MVRLRERTAQLYHPGGARLLLQAVPTPAEGTPLIQARAMQMVGTLPLLLHPVLALSEKPKLL